MKQGWLVVVLGACSDSGEDLSPVGALRTCLASTVDPGPGVPLDGGVRRWDVSGTVSARGPFGDVPTFAAEPCFTAPGRFIEITDPGGEIWRVGLLATEADLDRTPEALPALGATVSLTYLRADVQDAVDTALVMRSPDGLQLALEQGLGRARLSGLEPEALDGLVVSRAAPRLSFLSGPCGTAQLTPILFEGDGEPLELDTWEEGRLFVGGVGLQARNVGAWAYTAEVSCAAPIEPLPWVAWRG